MLGRENKIQAIIKTDQQYFTNVRGKFLILRSTTESTIYNLPICIFENYEYSGNPYD